MPVKIFFCDAHEDEPLLRRLKIHLRPLQREGLIEIWHDRDISAGSEWEHEIKKHLSEAQIILLLISPDFMDSDYCYSVEMQYAIERNERKEACVIPIILEHVYWQVKPLRDLQALPTDAKPIMSASWHNQNEALFDVVEGIRKVAEELTTEKLIQQIENQPDLNASSNSSQVATLTHQTGNDFMLANSRSQVAYVILEARATGMVDQVRMPLNLVLVLDHSGSMRGAKLTNVKEAVKMVITRLAPYDFISVIIFANTSKVIIPSMPAKDPIGMKAAIDHIQDAGEQISRHMSDGMAQGLNQFHRWNNSNTINRMILLTDSVTGGDSDQCRQLAMDAKTAGIAIYPMGIGADWDEDLLDSIGQLSGGMPAEFIRNPSDALAIFEQQVQDAVPIRIGNVTLTLRLPSGVSPKKAVKVSPIIQSLDPSVLSDRHILIPLGDLEKDNPQSVLVELIINSRPAGFVRLAQAQLSYDVPIANVVGESIRDDIKVPFTNDATQIVPTNEYVMNYVDYLEHYRVFEDY
jgi:Ca-activated chloride channel homolog